MGSKLFCSALKLTAMAMLVLAFHFVKGQHDHPDSFLLSGVLIDQSTGEPVPYANIVVDGSYAGTSSSEIGRFYLAVDPARMGYLRVSSIGYSTVRFRIDSLQEVDSPIIHLRPAIIKLDEVLVEASRASASDFVLEAISSLDNSLYPKDFLLEWHSTIVSTDSATGLNYSLETIFDDYYIGGKTTRTIRHQREKGISPILVGNPKDTLCAFVPWFEISFADIKNARYGVLNPDNINAFSFTYEGVLGLDGDSVFVIGYEAIDRSYRVTGATNKKISYGGKLYITTRGNALVRHTLQHSYQGYEKELIKEEVLYKEIGDYYFPYYIRSTRYLDVSRKFRPFHSNTYVLRDVRLRNIEYKPGYNWCDNRAPFDEDFWTLNYPKMP